MSQQNLSHLKLVNVSGDDAASFLQGQLSNDINKLDEGWQYSAYCTPKGRVLAVFIVWKHNDQIYLLVEKSILEPVLKRLKMFVMRSKVDIEEVDCEFTAALDDKAIEEIAPDLKLDPSRFNVKTAGKIHALSFGDRYLVINKDKQSNQFIGREDWLKKDIEEGLPRVTSLSSELFIPQMINMDLTNGISFKKGCYTGQEIIARMRYLGKLKQRMFVCQLPSAVNAEIGDKIVDADGKALGQIVNSLPNFELATASLRFESLDNGLFLENQDSSSLIVTDNQPYPIEA